MHRLRRAALASLSLPSALLAGCCSDGTICLTRSTAPRYSGGCLPSTIAAPCPRPAYVVARPTPEPILEPNPEPTGPPPLGPLPPAVERPLPSPSTGPIPRASTESSPLDPPADEAPIGRTAWRAVRRSY